MKAVHLSHYKNKLMDISKQFYLENDGDMPKGLIVKNLKNPLNFTRQEWQQALRIGQNPKMIKATLQGRGINWQKEIEMTITFKGIELVEEGKFVHLTITGKLEKEDYDIFVPEIDQQIKQFGKVNMLLELIDFHGWTAGAAWEDTKFGVRHFNDIERLAIVGDKTWEKGMAYFCKVFTLAKVRYFDINERDDAEAWAREAE